MTSTEFAAVFNGGLLCTASGGMGSCRRCSDAAPDSPPGFRLPLDDSLFGRRGTMCQCACRPGGYIHKESGAFLSSSPAACSATLTGQPVLSEWTSGEQKPCGFVVLGLRFCSCTGFWVLLLTVYEPVE